MLAEAEVEATTAPPGPPPAVDAQGRAPRWVPALFALAALVPRLATAGSFQVIDETLWMGRTVAFGDAILRGDLASASATTGDLATMPGVTTMWLGTLGRGLWAVGGGMGLIEGDAAFPASLPGIHLAQVVAAVATSLLVALIVALAWRWAGPIPALVAGALLATEPFLVAHGSVLHTDELTALYGASGTLALLLALGIPGPPPLRPRRLAVLAGVLLGAAALTKVSAMVLGPGIALVVLAAALPIRRWRRPGDSARPDIGQIAMTVGVAGLVALATVVVAWPALWVDPLHQLSLLTDSAGLASSAHHTYFLGEETSTPGPLFFAVSTPLRMTPWFLIGCGVLIPLAAMRGRRVHLALAVVLVLPVLYVLSTAAKQFDRYIILALPLVALMVGLGAEVVVRAMRSRATSASAAVLPIVGAAAVAGLVIHATAIAPWGLAYFNPLLGGSATAERAVLVGWGEGLELASARIEELEGPDCDVDVLVSYYIPSSLRCGRAVSDPHVAEYALVYVSTVQRIQRQPPWLRGLRVTATPLPPVRVRGIDYVELYDLRDGWSAEEPAGV